MLPLRLPQQWKLLKNVKNCGLANLTKFPRPRVTIICNASPSCFQDTWTHFLRNFSAYYSSPIIHRLMRLLFKEENDSNLGVSCITTKNNSSYAQLSFSCQTNVKKSTCPLFYPLRSSGQSSNPNHGEFYPFGRVIVVSSARDGPAQLYYCGASWNW